MNQVLESRIKELELLGAEFGVDFYPMKYEIVPIEVMLEVMSYGLPTRARHWKYGQSYEYQKMSGEMGFSKVYELVLNNDPSYAFLLDTNSDIANTMVSAHVLGHSHFFKHNYLFKQTDNKMVYRAAERAARIDEYIEKYGLNEVENIMNIAFAIDKHIDWHKGINRKPYGELSEKKTKEIKEDEFEDIIKKKIRLKKYEDYKKFPPHKEYDFLWFIINYCDIEDWKKDIFDIIRQESYYFYPQYMTKIMNEGFASFIHTELMLRLDSVSPSEFIEYVKIHERVVQPGANKFNINPYFLGFTILHDIKKRWDKLYEDNESDINGLQKIYEVVKSEDDISFIRNYLTKEIINDLKLFVYDRSVNNNGDHIITIESTDLDDVIEYIVKDIYHYRAPVISIVKASHDGLELEHDTVTVGTLDFSHLEKVMGYLYELWKSPVDIRTVDDNGKYVHLTYDENGFSI